MTLKDTIRIMKEVAMRQPAIRTICENDIYKLNADGNAWHYGVFAFVQGRHTTAFEDDFNHFNFSLFYVDRLIEDRSNQVDIQSTGVEVLNAIVAELQQRGIYIEGDYTFQPFNQRFADDCAGVFIDVRMEVSKNSICEEF